MKSTRVQNNVVDNLSLSELTTVLVAAHQHSQEAERRSFATICFCGLSARCLQDDRLSDGVG